MFRNRAQRSGGADCPPLRLSHTLRPVLYVLVPARDVLALQWRDGSAYVRRTAAALLVPRSTGLRSNQSDLRGYFPPCARYGTHASVAYDRITSTSNHGRQPPPLWEVRLFDRPKTGEIAAEVINPFGDEVLKVYPVA